MFKLCVTWCDESLINHNNFVKNKKSMSVIFIVLLIPLMLVERLHYSLNRRR